MTFPTFTVYVRNEPVTFTSAFATLREAGDFLRASGSGDLFVQSLLSQKLLSEKQVAWIHKLATDRQARVTPAAVEGLNLLPVVDMMHRARDAQKRRPRIVLSIFNDREPMPVVLQLASNMSTKPGSLLVSDGNRFGMSIYYGRVHTDGTVEKGRRWTPEVEKLLRELAANPLAVAQQHGVATGQCCFCNRPLSTKESRSAGYGPICAEKFGLAWGSTVAADAADTEAKALATHFANEAAAPRRVE